MLDALYAKAGQQIDNEKWQPAHNEHAHHDAQRLGRLLLFREFRQFP